MHARLGHIARTTMNAVIRSIIQTGFDTTIHGVIIQLPTGWCSICAQVKLKNLPYIHMTNLGWKTMFFHCCSVLDRVFRYHGTVA